MNFKLSILFVSIFIGSAPVHALIPAPTLQITIANYNATDLVITANGFLDVSNLSQSGDFGSIRSEIMAGDLAGFDYIWSGLIDGSDYYQLPLPHDIFTKSPFTITGTASGDLFGLFSTASEMYIYTADGFSSGIINGQLIIPNIQVSDLGPQSMALQTWGTAGPGEGLSIVAVPEPSTYAVFIGLLSLGFIALRRRSHC